MTAIDINQEIFSIEKRKNVLFFHFFSKLINICIFLSKKWHYKMFHMSSHDLQMSWTEVVYFLEVFGSWWKLLEYGRKIWIWIRVICFHFQKLELNLNVLWIVFLKFCLILNLIFKSKFDLYVFTFKNELNLKVLLSVF